MDAVPSSRRSGRKNMVAKPSPPTRDLIVAGYLNVNAAGRA